jgi:hypothetical protein
MWALQLEGKRFKFVDTNNNYEALCKESFEREEW